MKKRILSAMLVLFLLAGYLPPLNVTGAGGSTPVTTNYSNYRVKLTADSATGAPVGGASGFGTAASAGRIWTDKNVTANADGSFGVTLSALAQEFMTTSSTTIPGLGQNGETSAPAADVTFILDMSQSMTASDVANGSGGNYTRVKAMEMATNNAIRIVMEANPKNRVAVHWFGDYADVAHVGTLMEMGSYTLTSGSDYLVNSSSTISTNSALKKDNVAYTVRSQTLKAGTPTQDGIMYGASKMINNLGTDVKSASDPIRKPYVFILSDGAAIQGHKDWYSIPGNPQLPASYNKVNDANNLPTSNNAHAAASTTTGTSDIAAVTILTGKLMKNKVDEAYRHYNDDETITSKFYTVGLGADSAINGSSSSTVYAWAGLDPTNVFANKTNTGYKYSTAKNTHDKIVSYTSGTYSAYSSYTNDYIYSDYYEYANSYNALNGAFTRLANDVEASTTIIPLFNLPTNTNIGSADTTDMASAITIVDELGNGVNVDVSTLKISDAVAEVDSSITNGTMYKFAGYKSKAVIKTVSGATKLIWYIDSEDMQEHAYRFSNRSQPVAGQYSVPDKGNFELKYNLKPSFTEAPDEITQKTYLTNAVSEVEGVTEAKTVAYFMPSADSPYYQALTSPQTVSKSGGIGAPYVSKETLSGGKLEMRLGNNGQLDLEVGIIKSGPSSVAVNDKITYNVTVYNYTDTDKNNLTITSEGDTRTGVDVPANSSTTLTFDKTAPSTTGSITSDKAEITDYGLQSNAVDTTITEIPKFTVQYKANGGSSVEDMEVERGDKIIEPSTTKDGSIFKGWYKDEELNEEWDFDADSVTSDITLYAKWNSVPTIDDYADSTPFETPISGTVADGANDNDTDTLTYSKGSSPSNGSVVVNEDGSFTYTPQEGFHGEDSFTITVSDGKGGSATSTVTITVNEKVIPPNNAPTVEDYTLETEYETALNGVVKGEDSDEDALTYSKGSDPSHGSVIVNEDGSWIYTPEDGYSGEDRFTVTVSDGREGSATSAINITVKEKPNTPPTVDNYIKETNFETPVSGTVVGEDSDGDTLSYVKASNPTHGTVTVEADGDWTYTPNNGYSGTDSFTVTVSDGREGTATSTISITVKEKLNTPPTVDNYTKETNFETPVSGTVVGEDSDGDTLSYVKASNPTHGTVTVEADGDWTYTPNNGYSGTDSFTVTVSDGREGTATSTISITVKEKPNTPPTVDNYSKETNFETPVSGTVVGEDGDGDTLSYIKASNPTHGTVTVEAGGNWTYTPNNGYSGTDSFTVTVSDGREGTATSTISITVKEKPNTPPTVDNYSKETNFETPVSGTVVGEDGDGDTLSYIKASNPTHGTVTVEAGGNWTYTPNNGYSGTDSFTVTVSDGREGTATSTISITVKEKPNTPPTVDSYSKETNFQSIVNGKVIGQDNDGDTLTYTKETNPAHGSVSVNEDGTWIYSPNPGFSGTDSFKVTVSDGRGGTATSTITITVKDRVVAPNTPPTVVNYSIETNFETAVSGKVTGQDSDGDALTYTKNTDPDHGTVIIATDGSWTYTPNPGYSGTDSFKVTVSDGRGGTATSTITITVKDRVVAPNTPPTVGNYTKETNFETAVSGNVIGQDSDGDALTYTKNTNPTHGTVTVATDGNWTFTPDSGFSGTDSFKVTVSDGREGTATSTITITVKEKPNTPPTVGNYTKETNFETAVSGKVTGQDSDGDALTYAKNTDPVHGTVTVATDGNWTYTPNSGFSGTDNFKITVSDGREGTATSNITIIVKEKPNTPPTVGNYTKETNFETAVSGKVTGQDSDGDALTYAKNTDPVHGTVTVATDGNWTYTPNSGFSGTDNFKVTVSDGKGGSATSTVTLIIKEKVVTPNTPPTIGDYSKETKAGTPVSGKAVGKDSDGDELSYIKNSNPSHGNAVVSGDGSWTYTPNKDFGGNDSFTITVNDGHGGQAVSTIKIYVTRDLKVQITPNPSSIVADGKSTTTLTAIVKDSYNNPIAGANVVFSTERGTFPNGASAITDVNGKASVILKSERIESVKSHVIPVEVTVIDKEKGLNAKDQISITFEPASIQGTVVDNETGKPVKGATVQVRKDFDGDGVVDYSVKVVTEADGNYKIPVPRGDVTYEVLITTPRMINGKQQNITFVQNSKAGEITGEEEEVFNSVKTAAGIILIKQPDGTESFLSDYSGYSIEGLQNDENGGKTDIAVNGGIYKSGDAKGSFRIEDLEKGKSYTFNVIYHFDDGTTIVVGTVDVALDNDGQINISTVLIDPYGTITDKATGKTIEGADVKLYYADTPLNAKNGHKAGELVELPGLSNFPPADNKNPQFSDKFGKYAWMVFPESDYYIVATKDGYKKFVSSTIHVGKEIVNYDFQMVKEDSGNSGGEKPTDIPKTGDSPQYMYILIIALILFGAGAILLRKRK